MSESSNSAPTSPSTAIGRVWERVTGHPAGLSTLFFTEMWERASYYGMRALLVLFMSAEVAKGGMGWDDKTAGAIYGLYTAFVYLMSLPGGWIADRLLGARRSVLVGGIIITAGHFTMALPVLFEAIGAQVSESGPFFVGLVLVVIGTGFLKPNVSALVADVYPEGGARRDAGFTLFYMGINLGAVIGPLVCGYLGEKVNWHLGFGAAGIGMLFGVIQYWMTMKDMGGAGLRPVAEKEGGSRAGGLDRRWILVGAGIAVIFGAVILGLTGTVVYDPGSIGEIMKKVILAVVLGFFGYVIFFGGLDVTERKRTVVIMVLAFASVMFWAGFEQAGSSLNLFADRHTDRGLGFFGLEIPTTWYQSLNPLFIIVLAPVFAWFWVSMAKRMMEPSMPVKFAISLMLLASGFVLMVFAAKIAVAGNSAAPHWLILTYLLHTMGELCLSPVGLSSVTKLAPKRYASQMMGIWFVATSLGNLMAGLIAGDFSLEKEGGEPGALLDWCMRTFGLEAMPALFLQIVITGTVSGALLLIFAKPIQKWMCGVK